MKEFGLVFWDFLLIFLIILLIYIVFLNRKKKSYSKLKKNDEINLFIRRYNLDIKKHSFKKIKNTLAVINSFIIAFVATIIFYINGFFWKILVSFIVIFVLIYALYEIVGRYYKKMEEKKNV